MDTLLKKHNKMTLENFNKIDFKNYIGYYWFSDSENPVINNISKLEEDKIPFVIEGYLYNEQSKHSISIKNFNGKYVITEFKISEFEKEDNNEYKLLDAIAYPAYKLDNINKIIFRELQKKEMDESGFYFYKKVAQIFVGFEPKK